MGRDRPRWRAALLISAGGLALLLCSSLLDSESGVAIALFVAGLVVLAAAGALHGWRGAVTSAVLPALAVLVFPGDGPDPPPDPGGCDPFCPGPLAGIDDALIVATIGLLLALIGRAVAFLIATVRMTRARRRARA